MPKRARTVSRKDDNHWEIRSAFIQLGCSVVDTSLPPEPGFPDFLVGCMGVNHLVDAKNPLTAHGRAGLSVSQTLFNQRWNGEPVVTASTVDEVASLVQKWRLRR